MRNTPYRVSRRKNKGSVLAFAVVIAMILVLVGMALLSLGSQSRIESTKTIHELNARCAADAGLARALVILNNSLISKTWNSSLLPTVTNEKLPVTDALYSVQSEFTDGQYLIESTGISHNNTRTVRAKLRLKGLFELALNCKNNIILKAGTLIDSVDSRISLNPADTDVPAIIGTNSTASSSIVLNNHREYNTALIYPNPAATHVDFAERTAEEEKGHFRSIVTSVNTFLAPFERIVDFAVIDRDFDVARGELTSKASYRRKTIEANFAPAVALLYRRANLRVGGADVGFPNWLFQALGLTAQDLQIEAARLVLPGGKSLHVRRLQDGVTLVGSTVYAHPAHAGRGGWTWYTGSAGWMYRAGLESILGLRRHGGSFELDPCELSARMPVKPIEAVAEDYAGVDVSAFGRDVTPAHMTWYGVVVNGINYIGGCQTRFGPYPYCESMRATSYSTAKSAFVSVALMRLAQTYGADVANLLIKDYVPEYAASAGDWEQVTFNDTLDMATGNYDSAAFMADDDSSKMDKFFVAQPYAERIKAAFTAPHRA